MNRINISWPRLVIAFLLAPSAVPLTFMVATAATSKHVDHDEMIGTLLSFGIYTYIAALVLGIPCLGYLLIRHRVQLVHFVSATSVIALAVAILLTQIGMRGGGVVLSVVGGALAGACFFYLAGIQYNRSD